MSDNRSTWAFPPSVFIAQLTGLFEIFIRLMVAPVLLVCVPYVQYDAILWSSWGYLLLGISVPIFIWAVSAFFFTNETRIQVSKKLNIQEFLDFIDISDSIWLICRGLFWILRHLLEGIVFIFRAFGSVLHHLFDIIP
jgi:hypothetical protein